MTLPVPLNPLLIGFSNALPTTDGAPCLGEVSCLVEASSRGARFRVSGVSGLDDVNGKSGESLPVSTGAGLGAKLSVGGPMSSGSLGARLSGAESGGVRLLGSALCKVVLPSASELLALFITEVFSVSRIRSTCSLFLDAAELTEPVEASGGKRKRVP